MALNNSSLPITLEGKIELEKELEQLIKVDREEIKKLIQEARELGDLKENAEYHAAKEKQSMFEGRISELQHILSHSEVVDTKSIQTSKIVFGATVTLLDPQKEQKVTYKIVGKDEADIKRGRISFLSPLGSALIGKEEGDEVEVKAPKGIIEYEIISVEYK